MFSPRMWRCFLLCCALKVIFWVFSTYVEVFSIQQAGFCNTLGFLHVCGGVSENENKPKPTLGFSPRMWRCFRTDFTLVEESEVFSTYVEVFPLQAIKPFSPRRFLHVCGGVSVSV